MKYFRNTSWMFAEQMLRMAAGLLVGIWVARYLGPKQFGLFSYVLAFTTIFTSLAKLGLDGIVVRELVSQPEKQRLYLGTAFWLKFIAGSLTIALIASSLMFSNNDEATNQYIFIISVGLIFQSFEVIDFYFQSKVLAKYVAICKIIQLVFSSLIKIYLVFNQSELIWFVWVSLFDQVALAISLALAYILQRHVGFYRQFDFKVAKKLLNDSWPLMLSSFVTMIYMRIDQIMIKEWLGEYEVGLYSAAVRLSEVWYFVPNLLTASLFPAILNAKQVSKEFYYRRLQRLYTFLIWTAIAIAVPISLFSEQLIVFLYGEHYRSAGVILVINVWTGIFVSLFVVSGRWILAENYSMHALQRNFFAVIVNISMNYIFIRKYGVVGAAEASLLSMAAASLFYDMFFKEMRPMFILKMKAFFPVILK